MILTPIYIFLLIELSFVAFLDLKYRKIKNVWSVLNIIVAIALFAGFPNNYPLNIEMFQFALVFIVVGFALFMFKIMGGGDSKFLATFFLLVPLNFQEQVFYYLLIITIIVGLLFFINNIIVNHEKIFENMKERNIYGIKSCFGSKFAYAPVILITWIWFGWKIYIN